MTISHPSFGELSPDRVIIFDTTLRDGEQSPGFSMNLHEKLRMAHALAELGVDVLEAGFPIASPGDFDGVQLIAREIGQSSSSHSSSAQSSSDGPVIAGLARAARGDILRAAEAVAPARRRRIHTFIGTSPLHRKYQLRMDQDQVLAGGDVNAVEKTNPARVQFDKLHVRSERVAGTVLFLGFGVLFLMSREHARVEA